MTLFDMVLYCLTYQVLSYNNFIVSVIEVMPSRKEWLVDGLAEREEGFLKSKGRIKSQIVFHTLSVGHVVVLCSRKHFQVCYSINKCFIPVFRKPDFFCVWILHILIQIIFYFQVHKITSAKLFAVRYSHLTVMMLMMQVFLSVTRCHCAYGFRCYKQTQYLHLQVSSNPRSTDVMFLCNIWHHSTQNTVSHHRRPKSSSWFCL